MYARVSSTFSNVTLVVPWYKDAVNPPVPPQKSVRIASLDAIRGFDMFWILGLHEAMNAILHKWFPDSAWAKMLIGQFEHTSWSGFTFYDLIFPLFIFLAGISQAIALPRRVEREGVPSAVQHLLLRALILFLLGVFYNGGLTNGWDQIRWMGVLQRIGIASAAAGLLSLGLSTRGLILTTIGLLGGYAALFSFVPVPGTGVTGFEMGNNIVNYVDSVCLPGRLHAKTWDPEGLLSTIPAVGTALLGLLAGRWLLGGGSPKRVVLGLVGCGVLLVLAGWAWHPFFPVIKKLWTSSYVLVAAGWSSVFVGAFYWVIDVKGWTAWTTPFLWIGANPIALYLLAGLQLFQRAGERLIGKANLPMGWLAPIATVTVMLLFARWLYREKIFIRI
ncbi:MAG: DUF5009 domain-containing protein [Verrucomicrobiota bacterium]